MQFVCPQTLFACAADEWTADGVRGSYSVVHSAQGSFLGGVERLNGDWLAVNLCGRQCVERAGRLLDLLLTLLHQLQLSKFAAIACQVPTPSLSRWGCYDQGISLVLAPLIRRSEKRHAALADAAALQEGSGS